MVSSLCAKCPGGRASALPWPTLRGLLEQALYGGRLDNDNDTRVLQTYLLQLFAADVLPAAGGDAASASVRALTKGLVVPASRRPEDYQALAHALPERDAPAAFGLPANIDGSAQRTTAAALVAQLKKLAVLSSLSTGFQREQWRRTLAPLLGVWSSLTAAQAGALLAPPARFSAGRPTPAAAAASSAVAAASALANADQLTPIDSFVLLELQRAHALVQMVDSSLAALSRTVNGGALLTPAVQSLALPLLAGQLPWAWEKEWGSGPEVAAAYLRELAVRRLALSAWQARIESQSLLAHPLRLADLFNPATFLNALLQHTARTTREAIDNLKLVSALDRAAMPSSAPLVVRLEGLLLQGCALGAADQRLAPLVDASAPALVPLPAVFVAWVPKAERECYADADSVVVPLYPTLRRERTVCELRVPCQPGAQAAAVLAGVALFLTDIM